ncbi:MAG: hypothetical protein ABI426_10635 [Flavobacterium sp.]
MKEEKLDSILNTTILNLKSKKITDVFCISESYWETDVREIYDTKTDKIVSSKVFDQNVFTLYVFWKENAKVYIQKFDHLNKFKPIELHDFGLFDMIKNNLSKIKKEKVLPYQIRIGFRKVTLNHVPAIQQKIYFCDENEVLRKEFQEYYLVNTDYDDGSNKNLNFKYNSKLKIIEIYNVCKSKIKEAEDNKLFHIVE